MTRYEIHERMFNDNWNALLGYWKENGHANPPLGTVWNYYNIGTFATGVRYQKRHGLLSPEREHKLRILNFDFEPRLTNRCNKQQRQQQRLKLLKEYKQEFGRLPTTPENGIYKGVDLRGWLTNGKVMYRQGNFDEELVRELEELGVVFGRTIDEYQNERNKKIHDEWLVNYNKLLKHFSEHGNLLRMGAKLRNWKQWQPQRFRNGHTSEVETHLLNLLEIDVAMNNRQRRER